MDDNELFNLLSWVEERVPLAGKPARFEEEAGLLEPGTFGRASLLTAAGEHWQMRGEFDEARRCFLLAQQDGGESATEPIASLLSLAIEEGDEEAVAVLDRQLRQCVREDGVSVASCHHVAESYELHGRLPAALRWCNIPFTHHDPGDDPLDEAVLVARRRIKDALGMPPDQFDGWLEP